MVLVLPEEWSINERVMGDGDTVGMGWKLKVMIKVSGIIGQE